MLVRRRRKYVFESVELSFTRKLSLIVFAVLFPGFIYGGLLFLGNYRPEFDVRNKMTRIVFLEDVQGSSVSVFLDRPGQLEKCVRERGRELCLRLLGHEIARSLAGEPGAVPDTAYRSSHRDGSSPNFVSHLRVILAGIAGVLVALVGVGVGWSLRA